MASDEERVVVLGGAAGAWGDSSFSAPQLLDSGRCHYILFEALAEITMGILTLARIDWLKWAHWMWPLQVIFTILGLLLLVPPVLMGWQ